jgi:hypothetical protein
VEKKQSITEKEKDAIFDELLDAAINEVLREVIGDKGAKTVYYFAKNAYDLEKEDVVKNIQTFQVLLNDLFKVGAVLMEQKIMERLYSKVSAYHKNILLDCKNFEEFDFITYIVGLRVAFKKEQLYRNTV